MKKPVDPSDTKIAPSEEPPMHSTPNPSIGVAVNSQSGQFKPGCSCDLEVELQVTKQAKLVRMFNKKSR